MLELRICVGYPDQPHRLHKTTVFFCFFCVLGADAQAAACIIERHRGSLLVGENCYTAVPTCRRNHPSTVTYPGVWRAATVPHAGAHGGYLHHRSAVVLIRCFCANAQLL